MLSVVHSVTNGYVLLLWYCQVCIIKEEWLGGVVKETLMTSCNIDNITTVTIILCVYVYRAVNVGTVTVS